MEIGPPISRSVDQRAQRDHLARCCCGPGSRLMSSTRSRNSPSAWIGDLPVPAEIVEAVDVERAQIHVERLVDVVERDAQRGDLGAVDVQEELRRVGAELRGRDAGKAGHARCSLRTSVVGLLSARSATQAAAVLDHELEAAGRRPGPASATRRKTVTTASVTFAGPLLAAARP